MPVVKSLENEMAIIQLEHEWREQKKRIAELEMHLALMIDAYDLGREGAWYSKKVRDEARAALNENNS